MDSRELGARECRVADRRARSVDEVDHPVRQARFLHDAHQVVGRQRGGRGRLPEHRVPHQRRRAREISSDAREVEGADREDEPFERPVLHAVPDAGRRVRLLRVDPRDVVGVEAPEVDHLAHGVDLRLVRGLRLVEHRRRVQRRAPGPGEELGRAQEDRRALVPGSARPVRVRFARGVDGLLDVLGAALADVGQDVALAMRHHRLERLVGVDVLAADDEGDADALALHLAQASLQLGALGGAGCVGLDGLVDRRGRAEDSVGAHGADCKVVRGAGGADAVRGGRLGRGGALDRGRCRARARLPIRREPRRPHARGVSGERGGSSVSAASPIGGRRPPFWHRSRTLRAGG